MKFYLMRHGQAEVFAKSDELRNLTADGRSSLLHQISTHQASLADVDCVLHSPYLRAQQTAELVAQYLFLEELHSLSEWQPDEDPAKALASLETFIGRCPLIVCHMPLIGRVTALCCEGDYRNPDGFACGEIAIIEADWPAAGLGLLRQRLV